MNSNKQILESDTSYGWWLSRQHQLAIALLSTIALFTVGLLFGWSAWQGDQNDIDRAQSLPQTFQVDINRAAVGELMAVPSVGPKMAQAIVDYRNLKGQFGSLDMLQEVPGIGPKKLAQLKKYLLPMD